MFAPCVVWGHMDLQWESHPVPFVLQELTQGSMDQLIALHVYLEHTKGCKVRQIALDVSWGFMPMQLNPASAAHVHLVLFLACLRKPCVLHVFLDHFRLLQTRLHVFHVQLDFIKTSTNSLPVFSVHKAG